MNDTGKRGKENSLGKNLKIYRKQLGYSQAKIGKMLGKTQTAISEIELGKNLKNVKDINAMLDIFKNVTYDELFNTDRTSVYISESNDEKLNKHIEDFEDLFAFSMTDYQKKAILINLILKIYLDNELSLELKETIKNEIKKLSVI